MEDMQRYAPGAAVAGGMAPVSESFGQLLSLGTAQ